MMLFSLWQPWASFMYREWKRNETRSWSTKYRGPMAIHAAKNRSALKDTDEILEDAGFDMPVRICMPSSLPLGVILCVVDLVDCVPTESIRDSLSLQEHAMGDYSDGRYAWVTQNLRKLHPYVTYRGTQGLRPVASAALRQIEAQLHPITKV